MFCGNLNPEMTCLHPRQHSIGEMSNKTSQTLPDKLSVDVWWKAPLPALHPLISRASTLRWCYVFLGPKIWTHLSQGTTNRGEDWSTGCLLLVQHLSRESLIKAKALSGPIWSPTSSEKAVQESLMGAGGEWKAVCQVMLSIIVSWQVSRPPSNSPDYTLGRLMRPSASIGKVVQPKRF